MKTLHIISFALLTALVAPLADGAAASPAIVSRAIRPSLSGSGHSFTPAFGADGRVVLFVSQAKDLVTNGTPSSFLDVFVRDLVAGQTSLVTVNTNAWGGGDGDSSFATISSNGQYVAFESSAGNLTSNDTNGYTDVFVRDLIAGTTLLLSRDTNRLRSGNGPSVAPLISADGRRVVFESTATNLVLRDFNGRSNDVFVCEMDTRAIHLVSVNSSGTGTARGASDSASMSADGRFVAFRSFATNVVAATSNRYGDIFIRDLESQITIWASHDTGSRFTNGLPYACSNPAITADGRYVTYIVTEALNPSGPRFLRRYEIQSGLTLAITSNLANPFLFGESPPVISPNGRYVAYETRNYWTLADLDAGTFEPVHALGLTNSRAPVFLADSSGIVFLGADSVNGPWSVYVRAFGGSTQELVSVTTNGTAAEVVSVSLPAVSQDGRRVAFESAAANLVADDFNEAADVFLRNLDTGETQLVSARANGVMSSTAARGAIPSPRAVSMAGRFVAFASLDNHLADGDDNPWQDVFVRDTLAGTTEVLRLPGPSPLGSTRLAFSPVLSVDGRYAAWFEQSIAQVTLAAAATNILWLDRQTGDAAMLSFAGTALGGAGPMMSSDGRWIAFADRPTPGGVTNVYVRDMLSSTASNELVSVNRFNTGAGDGHSFTPVISPDNRWIAFLSRARDLIASPPANLPFVTQVYVRDRMTGVTRLISTDSTGANGLPGDCSSAMFSSDSRCVFFFSRDPASVSNILYRHTLATTNRNEIVCAGCSNPSASADGRFVAFGFRTPFSGGRDVYLRDMRDRMTVLVTTNVLFTFPPGGDRESSSPQVSYDGRYVVFASQARNLLRNDTNNVSDIFVYDRVQRTIIPISTSSRGGGMANNMSTLPVLAPDGRTIVFASFATDLAPGDFNNACDIYVLRLGGPDADEDRLDDDWEVTYFGNLEHDGASDSDGDGWTDWQEFQVGTDPINSGSILRVLTVGLAGGTTRTIYWSSVPGRTYRVQLKFTMNDPEWQYLPGRVTATDTTASLADYGSGPHGPPRFYRVELEQ